MEGYRDSDHGEHAGNLFDAIAVHYPEREAALLRSRPPLMCRWRLRARDAPSGARGWFYDHSGDDFPEPESWYEPLMAAMREVYKGLPQPRGEPYVFNCDDVQLAGLPQVVVSMDGTLTLWTNPRQGGDRGTAAPPSQPGDARR